MFNRHDQIFAMDKIMDALNITKIHERIEAAHSAEFKAARKARDDQEKKIKELEARIDALQSLCDAEGEILEKLEEVYDQEYEKDYERNYGK